VTRSECNNSVVVEKVNRPGSGAGLLSRIQLAKRNFAAKKTPSHHRIEINLVELNQLFNSMDPSPFHEKDLDHDAEEFIEGWVLEYHRHEPVSLLIHLERLPDGDDPKHLVEQAIHHFYAYKAKLNTLEFRRLMRQGRTSLFIGLVFLAVCMVTAKFVMQLGTSTAFGFMKESLMIAGTVAMWRPIEIYLYEWWPLRRRGMILEKMSRMPVEVRKKS
jgi:hypothetical protein